MPRIVKDPEERRRELLACAMRLFAEEGYDNVSVRRWRVRRMLLMGWRTTISIPRSGCSQRLLRTMRAAVPKACARCLASGACRWTKSLSVRLRQGRAMAAIPMRSSSMRRVTVRCTIGFRSLCARWYVRTCGRRWRQMPLSGEWLQGMLMSLLPSWCTAVLAWPRAPGMPDDCALAAAPSLPPCVARRVPLGEGAVVNILPRLLPGAFKAKVLNIAQQKGITMDKTNEELLKERSRHAFDAQAATYDKGMEGEHARRLYPYVARRGDRSHSGCCRTASARPRMRDGRTGRASA